MFLELLRQAHARKIRVIIDGVFNHTGRDFFAFADLRKRQAESPYRDWYIVQAFDDPATPHNEFRYKGWWGVDTLPEFADNEAGDDLHPGPKQYVLDSTQRWMDPNGDGDPARRHRRLAAGRGQRSADRLLARLARAARGRSIRSATPWPRSGTMRASFSRTAASRPR